MIQTSGRVCANCGTALAPNATFCSNCGRPYHPTPIPHNGVASQAHAGYAGPSTNTPGVVRKRSRMGLIITIICILLLPVIVGGGLFVFVIPHFQGSNNTTSKSNVPSVPQLNIKPYTYTRHTSVVWQVSWSPNGKLIASSGGLNDDSVQIWNAETGKKQASFQDYTIVNAVAWSPNSKYVASGGNSYAVDVINATNGDLESWCCAGSHDTIFVW